METNPITKRWREIRKAIKLSQPEMAEIIGTTQAAISLIESGKTKNPSSDIINKLFKAFPQLSREWFFDGTGSMFDVKSKALVSSFLLDEELFEIPQNYRHDPVLKEYMTKLKTLVASQQEKIEKLEQDKMFLQGLVQKQTA